jgi:prevent-host-death family protein
MTKPRRKTVPKSRRDTAPRWSVERAKAHLSELMTRAREDGPQRITLYGRDAVVVVDAGTFDTMAAANAAPTLRQLLKDSPLRDLPFDRLSFSDPVRPVKL